MKTEVEYQLSVDLGVDIEKSTVNCRNVPNYFCLKYSKMLLCFYPRRNLITPSLIHTHVSIRAFQG